jgi:NADH:ubiquinone oxidoreductase subunit 5 (subunit L)/multisubunit Na+/H+ antiporter MnhA subunit
MSAFLTAFYSIRLIYWVFLGSVNFYKSNLSLIIESGFFMVFPMFILSFLSIFIGYLFNEAFIGIGNSLFWNNSIFLLLYNYSFFDVEFNLFMLKFIPLIITLLGIIFFFFSIYFFEKIFFFFFKNKKIFFFYKIFSKALFFDFIIIDFFFLNLLKISYLNIYKYIEKGFFELIFYKYVYNFFFVINSYLVKLNSGLIYNYIFLIIFLFVFFFFIIQILFIFSFFHIIIIFYGFFFTIYIFL